jgi:hypothetical protein
LIRGLEIIVITIFMALVLYFRNPAVVGIIGKHVKLTLGLIGYFLNKEMK